MTGTAEAFSSVTPAYFDSALVAKFYLNESGRGVIRRLAATSGVVVTSGIAFAEVSAAFHRKLREGALERDVFDALQGQFREDLKRNLWHLAWPTEDLFHQVHALYSRLEGTVILRPLDALHLVTAKAAHFDRIYSNDRHLLNACASVNLQGINPLVTTAT